MPAKPKQFDTDTLSDSLSDAQSTPVGTNNVPVATDSVEALPDAQSTPQSVTIGSQVEVFSQGRFFRGHVIKVHNANAPSTVDVVYESQNESCLLKNAKHDPSGTQGWRWPGEGPPVVLSLEDELVHQANLGILVPKIGLIVDFFRPYDSAGFRSAVRRRARIRRIDTRISVCLDVLIGDDAPPFGEEEEVEYSAGVVAYKRNLDLTHLSASWAFAGEVPSPIDPVPVENLKPKTKCPRCGGLVPMGSLGTISVNERDSGRVCDACLSTLAEWLSGKETLSCP